MRIALTCDPELPVPPEFYGGIERVVDMLARRLVARGHDLTLFAHPSSQCPVPKRAWPGASSLSRFDTFRNAGELARAIAGRRFDIIHSFSRLAYLAPLLPSAIPKLMTYQREISPRTTGLAQRLSRGTLQFSAISEHMVRHVRHIGAWHIVPNGVPSETYTFREQIPDDAPLVFLGRVEEIKGPHLAIAAARLAGRRLVIAGNLAAEHRAWFEAHIAPHLHDGDIDYVGPVDDRQKNQLLGGAAALLMPILWEEPFGIVMAEAMACGSPVIGFGRGAVPEVVEHGRTGYVVDTVEEMAAAIARLESIERAACRQRVETLYSEDAVTDRYLQIYEAMIARRGSRAAA
ncbi:glycosyltransferase family 4 protein [Labrys sp. KNU-23]|uniref:glycosyltransferase family 4 protein n=1 Tax=Labrys sp. KNU-23 TaxID=2789216 RepID=UPI0011ED0EDA|nr:glycosyltransferase family 4 protein [Labrys sp. KNU-23]QEN85703.1 glycosyltransferase family 4 protein [Labrys sp. KNU-23]